MNLIQARRSFCKTIGISWLEPTSLMDRSASLAEVPETGVAAGDLPPPENFAARGEVPLRKFGKSDELVSALAVGGHAIGKAKSKRESIRIVQEAIDEGITFMDNAWDYHEGRSEVLMGEALKGRRDQVFLMTKVCSHGRDKQAALKQLDQSLKRLKTDRLDLWQIHEVVYDNDPDLHFAHDGAAEALIVAREQGKVRFLGFTGHKSPALHLKMLNHDFPFDAVQMPLSGFDANFRSFEKEVLPVLLQRGIAPLGMKSLNGTAEAVKKKVVTAKDAIRYAMSLPVTTTVSGMDSLTVLRKNLKIARNFVPMTKEEKDAYRTKCAAYAQDGRFELYKVSISFDGAEGRKQHGFPPEKHVEA